MGPLGANWDFADNRRLVVANPLNLATLQMSFPHAQVGDVVRMDGYSRADRYVNNGSGFDAPEGFFTQLEQIVGGGYEERDSSNNVVVYGLAEEDYQAGADVGSKLIISTASSSVDVRASSPIAVTV